MIVREKERYMINGAAFEVHNTLGCGFNEYVYQDALEIEFKLRGIPYEREKRLLATYKGETLKHEYSADFICFGDIIIECKAATSICERFEAQTLNYMKMGHFPVGILLNFGELMLGRRYFILK